MSLVLQKAVATHLVVPQPVKVGNLQMLLGGPLDRSKFKLKTKVAIWNDLLFLRDLLDFSSDYKIVGILTSRLMIVGFNASLFSLGMVTTTAVFQVF